MPPYVRKFSFAVVALTVLAACTPPTSRYSSPDALVPTEQFVTNVLSEKGIVRVQRASSSIAGNRRQ